MTPSQLKTKYKCYSTEQLHMLSDVYKKTAVKNQREHALMERELKRRKKCN